MLLLLWTHCFMSLLNHIAVMTGINNSILNCDHSLWDSFRGTLLITILSITRTLIPNQCKHCVGTYTPNNSHLFMCGNKSVVYETGMPCFLFPWYNLTPPGTGVFIILSYLWWPWTMHLSTNTIFHYSHNCQHWVAFKWMLKMHDDNSQIIFTVKCHVTLKWVTLGKFSYFNGGSCYRYNHTRINCINKLSASIYTKAWRSPYIK